MALPSNFYQVTLTFASGSTQSDIALRAKSAKDGREYVTMRAEEWSDKPTSIKLKRISAAGADSIVEGGGIDWAR